MISVPVPAETGMSPQGKAATSRRIQTMMARLAFVLQIKVNVSLSTLPNSDKEREGRSTPYAWLLLDVVLLAARSWRWYCPLGCKEKKSKSVSQRCAMVWVSSHVDIQFSELVARGTVSVRMGELAGGNRRSERQASYSYTVSDSMEEHTFARTGHYNLDVCARPRGIKKCRTETS